MNTNMKARFLAIVGSVAVLGLGACSVGIDSGEKRPDVSASSSSNDATSAAVSPTTAPVPTANGDTGSGLDGGADVPDAVSSGAMREELSVGVVTELTCPDGVVDIGTTASAVEVVEDCDIVNVSGDVSTVVTQKIGTLNLDASGTVVLMSSADYVNLAASGSINTVVWERGNPVVNDLSVSSVVVSESRMP